MMPRLKSRLYLPMTMLSRQRAPQRPLPTSTGSCRWRPSPSAHRRARVRDDASARRTKYCKYLHYFLFVSRPPVSTTPQSDNGPSACPRTHSLGGARSADQKTVIPGPFLYCELLKAQISAHISDATVETIGGRTASPCTAVVNSIGTKSLTQTKNKSLFTQEQFISPCPVGIRLTSTSALILSSRDLRVPTRN